jgi:hypothetical protein
MRPLLGIFVSGARFSVWRAHVAQFPYKVEESCLNQTPET